MSAGINFSLRDAVDSMDRLDDHLKSAAALLLRLDAHSEDKDWTETEWVTEALHQELGRACAMIYLLKLNMPDEDQAADAMKVLHAHEEQEAADASE